MGAQINRGLHNGCVARRTFDPQYTVVIKEAHALAKCCAAELPYLGMEFTQPVKGQGF